MPTPKFLRKPIQVSKRRGMLRFVARWWVGVGALMLLFTVIFALLAIFGTPVIDADTGQPASEQRLAATLLVLGGAGAIGVIVGLARLKRLRD